MNTLVIRNAALAVVMVIGLVLPASAQDVPPCPERAFKGKIGRTAAKSTPDSPKGVTAPNVPLILTGDVGFGASSTLGGAIPTPTMDQLAKEGLRYNTFRPTALCSPTRTAGPDIL